MFITQADIDHEIVHITDWIQNRLQDLESAIVEINGSADSTVTAAFLLRALGQKRVYGIILSDSELTNPFALNVIQYLEIPFQEIRIDSIVNAMEQAVYSGSLLRRTEKALWSMPKQIQSAVLSMVANSMPSDGQVVNVSNRSDSVIGVYPKFGNLGDLSVLRNYTITEILKLGAALGLPDDLLCVDPKSRYRDVDVYLLNGTCSDSEIPDQIEETYQEYKQNPHPVIPACPNLIGGR